MNSNRKTLLSCIVLLAGTLVSGCVYYNTFYNARKQFQEAERKREEAENVAATDQKNRQRVFRYRDFYWRSIRKASIVLDRHPDSEWVDDSLLLIGKAFYWLRSYRDALLKFQELQDNFPESLLLTEALYWKGLSLWAAGRAEEARPALANVGESADPQFTGKARLALAELEAEAGDHAAAINAYQKLLEARPRGLATKIWLGIGNARFHLEQYEDALLAYRRVLKSKPKNRINFETRLQIGGILERQGKLDEVLATYNRILKIKSLRSYEPEVHLKRANVYQLMGKQEIADEIYNEVIERNPKTEHSAEAYYRLAMFELTSRRNMERAKELFASARKEKSGSDAGKAARDREKDLVKLERFQKSAAKGKKKGLKALFNVAEMYLFNLSEPDSALATYYRAYEIADSLDTELAPKALYAMGLIYADSLKNQEAAQKTFRKLIDTYPVNPYAVSARQRLTHALEDDARAEARFREAETRMAGGGNPPGYLDILKQLPLEYPNSPFSARALYTIAWTYANRMENPDSAQVYYQKLVDGYPLTEFAELASKSLKGDFLKVIAQSGPDAEPADGADGAAPAAPRRDKRQRDSDSTREN
ncbi:MAG: tetratricopeptide repeat protein [Candidatus Latescibacteria bacterium]|nr:tetratricopeptide repeat protein [Candidatus Latescibacterota bacterium]